MDKMKMRCRTNKNLFVKYFPSKGLGRKDILKIIIRNVLHEFK
jgi:hypothetical protein